MPARIRVLIPCRSLFVSRFFEELPNLASELILLPDAGD